MNNPFKNKRVLVFGLGLNQGGVGSVRFFASQGAKVRVTDLKTKKVLKPSLDQLKDFPEITYTLGVHKYEDFDWADLIIKNPAVKPGNPYIEYVLKHNKQVEMDMGIFLQFVKPSQIIGVTGTKGKSTTASLIYEILKQVQDDKVIFAGNIGKSVLDTIPFVVPDTLVILEISSFQLEAFDQHKLSPKWAVITNLTPDHLNYYKSMDEYIAAKKIVGKYQTKDDFLFIRKGDPIIDTESFLKRLNTRIIRFSKNDLPKNFHPHLLGEHNLENMAAAISVAKVFGIPKERSLKPLSNFKGIPFRMELVKVWHGVKIYNDTTATSPEAGIQAIKTLGACLIHPPGDLILICGGMNKGMDYTKYAAIAYKFVNKIFFLEGDATEEIKKQCQMVLQTAFGRTNVKCQIRKTYNNLENLLTDVKKIVKSGDIVLFSPAATSFNLFQNEFDRGRKFNTALEKVFGR